MVKKLVPVALIFLTVFLLYRPALLIYFSQDDFFHFKLGQTGDGFWSFIRLFGFYPFEERGIAFYRPVFREALFNLFYSLFGLNSLPFRVFAFLLHFTNILLVLILIQKISHSRLIAFFATFFFGIASANVATLYYLAGGIQALGMTFFLLLSVMFFWDWLKKGVWGRKIASFAFFLLALASHEQAVVIPFLFSGVVFLQMPIRKGLRYIVKELWPFFVILALFVYLDLAVIGLSKGEQEYSLIFSVKRAINSLTWYGGWALGLPEMLIDFVQPGLKLNPSLMRYWGDYFSIIFLMFFVSIALIVVSLTCASLRDKRFWFFVLWFVGAMGPVIFLPFHKSTYYLYPALPAFWAAVGWIIFSSWFRTRERHPFVSGGVLGAVGAAVFVLSATSTRLGETTYWAATRGRIAQKLILQTKETYPTLPRGAVVYFLNDPNYPYVAREWGGTSKQASFILNGSDALQLLYRDSSLKVYYEDLGGLIPDAVSDNVYRLIARIN